MHARARLACLALTGMALVVLVFAGPALAGPWWRLSARAAPTYLAPGEAGLVDVSADDLGDVGVTGAGKQVTIKDVLPVGLVVSEAGAINPHRARAGNRSGEEKTHWSCSVAQAREVACSTALAIPPYELLEVEIPVKVDEPPGTATTLSNEASVQGGESQAGGPVAGVSLTRPVRISDQAVAFGVEEGGYTIVPENEEGALDTQAGSHPFQLTSTVDFNQVLEEVQEPGQKPLLEPAAPALPKDLRFNLPPGLLGNVTAVQQCSELDFSALKSEGNSCPAASAIGIATVTVLEPSRAKYITKAVPLFNLEPERGEPARFGFEAVRVPVLLDTSVRTDGDYGVSVNVSNTTEAAQVLGAQITFWGEPDSPTHDNSRGWACNREGAEAYEDETCEPPSPRSNTPFLTLPTACTGPLSTSMQGNSWGTGQLESQYTFENDLGETLASLEGCQALPFEPSIGVQPEQQPEEGRSRQLTSTASTPTGLQVSVNLAQQGTLTDGLLADADLRSTTVTLPEGLVLSSSAANGLQACSETQVGYLGQGASDPLSPGAQEPLRFSSEQAQCPQASKIGTVHIRTPLLSEELQGGVYVAAPAPDGEAGENPFNSLIAIYIIAENPVLGLRVKLAGEGRLNERTGQITTTFQNTPQVPFETLNLQLFGGPRGALATPALCASYATSTSFTAWSGAVRASSSQAPFNITAGPGGGPCPSGSLPFSPSFQAGSTSNQAGGFTAFTLKLENPDGDQALTGLSMHLPTGVAALLSTVTPCPEPPSGQEWACGAESLLGSSSASSGLGSEPYVLPGRVYLTVGYGGAPFGLLVVTPAVAGPYDLGNVDVRSRINVNPDTAAVSITGEPFPTFIRGIPVALKQIDVNIDRANFEFNPTNCSPMKIEGTLTGAQGASESVSSPFQAAGCDGLQFAPKLTAATDGQGSKADGASLDVKVQSAGLGQANIAKVDLQLPKALPARLTTIQKACVASVFEANPASCDEGSVIGYATINTPVLRSPLSGPAYLVSHGGAAFPDVEFVLQGEGVTIVLDGKTDIKDGITYSRFESAPDAPFTSFETVLPTGPHSALTANVPEKDDYNLCTTGLSMPTEITAQNGAVIHQSTHIAVQGCKAVKAYNATKLTRAQRLAKALVVCRRRYRHHLNRRASCERLAKSRYTAKKAAHKKATRTNAVT